MHIFIVDSWHTLDNFTWLFIDFAAKPDQVTRIVIGHFAFNTLSGFDLTISNGFGNHLGVVDNLEGKFTNNFGVFDSQVVETAGTRCDNCFGAGSLNGFNVLIDNIFVSFRLPRLVQRIAAAEFVFTQNGKIHTSSLQHFGC